MNVSLKQLVASSLATFGVSNRMLQHAVECCAPETLLSPFPVSGRESQKGLASGNIRLLTPPPVPISVQCVPLTFHVIIHRSSTSQSIAGRD